MSSSHNKHSRNRKAVKRKCDTSLDSSQSDTSLQDSGQCIWSTYRQIYDIICVNPGEVQTTEECVANTRVIDVATTKLIDDVQRLDLCSVDLWHDISERLVRDWEKYFCSPENVDGWSLGDLVPINRFKANYFNAKALLLKRLNPDEKKIAQSQKQPRIRRKDADPQTKTTKPIQGMSEDKPPLLIEHMERIKAVLSKLCTQSRPSVPYLRLVLHPTSFSSTVYNIFAVAFLIREGMLSLTIGNDDEPLVKPLYSMHSFDASNDNRKKSNFLIALTTAEWQILVEKLSITHPLIPCPDGLNEEDEFYEKFTMSQKEKRKAKKAMNSSVN